MAASTTEFWQSVGIAIAGIAGTIAGVKKWQSVNSGDRKEQAVNDASTSVIGMLRAEVERLADQNDKLLRLVHTLQNQIVEIRQENIELRNIVERFSYGPTDSQALDQCG